MPTLTEEEIRELIGSKEICAISVDTSIFKQKGHNFENYGLLLLGHFEKISIDVLITEVVCREVVKHIRIELDKSKKEFEQKYKRLKNTWKLGVELDSIIDQTLSQKCSTETSDQLFTGFLKKIGANRLELPKDDEMSREVLERYFSEAPPFGDSEKKKYEFPDAFALLSLEHYAKSQEKKLLFISNDGDWSSFADKSDWLICVSKIEVALSLFNAKEIIEEAEKIVASWRRQEFFDLTEQVIESINNTLEDSEFTVHAASSLSFEVEPTGAKIEEFDFESITDPRVVYFDDDIIGFAVQLDAMVEFSALFDFYIKDGIDRDYVSIGSNELSSENYINFQVIIEMNRQFDDGIIVHDVEIEHSWLDVEFDLVEPFF